MKGEGGTDGRVTFRTGRYKIHLADRQRALAVDPRFLKRAARQTLAAEQVARAELSLVLVDDAEMQELNARHLQHDCPTDVISFLLDSEPASAAGGPAAGGEALRGAGKTLCGEVIISTDTAIREAADYRWDPQGELLLYLVHGILHLCGYNDLCATELRCMRAREVAVLAKWNLQPPYTESGAHAELTPHEFPS